MEVNIHHAKTHLSRLIERALAGEEVIVARAGKPVVRISPIASDLPVLGSARGSVVYKEGWDAPMTDAEMAEIENGPVFPE